MGGGFISNTLGALFGTSEYEAPELPEYKAPPDYTETDAETKAARDTERRKIRARRGMSGTILTSPLGAVGVNNNLGGILGNNFGNNR